MTNHAANPRAGLKGMLAAVPGLRVVDRPDGPVDDLPAAVVLFEGRDAGRTLGRGASGGRMLVVLLVSSTESAQACDALDRYAAPAGPDSIEAAVSADTTWGGSVDDGRLVSVDGVGPRKLWGTTYVAADLHFRYVKRTAPV